MQKRGARCTLKKVLLTVVVVLFVLFVILPLSLTLFDGSKLGNVAKIPIHGPLTVDGSNYLGQPTTSSETIVGFLKEAGEDPQIKAIVLEINSPGGSAVGSDEIASAVKKSQKPVVAVIRETGASGGYWIASAADHVIANRMAITGSIGVVSSYLEFSKLMEEYGVGYERLVAGEYKDMGTPFRKLSVEEKNLFEKKIAKIQDYFIDEIAANRNLPRSKIQEMATGEFFLGVEALERGLIDELGDLETAEKYLKTTSGLEEIDYVVYEKETGLLDLFTGVFADWFFKIGEGLGAVLLRQESNLIFA